MTYRAGWIHYTNVAPILDSLALPSGVTAVTGVPTEMNAALLAGRVDIANISAVEFVRHADTLEALPDFSVSVLGPVYSVNLFHTAPLERVRRQGYAGRLLGEDISETYENEIATLGAWMQTRDTRDILMDPAARELGMGWFQEQTNKIWWTVLVGG